MKRGVLAGIVLALLFVALGTPVAVAAQEFPLAGTDTHAYVLSLEEAAGAASKGGTEDVAEPTMDPVETPEPTTEPTAEPTPGEEATSEPTSSPTPAPPRGPSLEVAGSATLLLNEETPEVRIIWNGATPENVAGYVWSYGVSDGSLSIFNISYDSKRLELPAGALNGHIRAAGTYVVHCQPVDDEQKAATPGASTHLTVEASARQLTISASKPFPVAAGSSLELMPDIGDAAAEVVRYEWKPSGSNPGGSTCRIYSVSAGATRYTCTAVLEGGERITGTILVTGSELEGVPRAGTVGAGGPESLSVSWSNGPPAQNLAYVWRVRGETGVDLSAYSGPALPMDALRALSPRTNPYVVTCQAYDGHSNIGHAASFNVRASGNPGVSASRADARSSTSPTSMVGASQTAQSGTAPSPARQVGEEQSPAAHPTGPIPDTGDEAEPVVWFLLLVLGAAALGWAARRWVRGTQD